MEHMDVVVVVLLGTCRSRAVVGVVHYFLGFVMSHLLLVRVLVSVFCSSGLLALKSEHLINLGGPDPPPRNKK